VREALLASARQTGADHSGEVSDWRGSHECLRTARTAACVRSQAKLAQDLLDVYLCGFVSDPQLFGNILIAQPQSNLLEHLVLALRDRKR
jgi:hypothetical protein